jgi:AraC-type transcriptional regulator N-terminus
MSASEVFISQESNMTIQTLNYDPAIAASLNGEISPTQRQMAIDECTELAALVDRQTNSQESGYCATAIEPLIFVRCSTSKIIQEVSEPLFAIVVQGEKKLSLNEEILQYGVAQYLLLSVDLPLSVCMIDATPDRPYLGLKLKLGDFH